MPSEPMWIPSRCGGGGKSIPGGGNGGKGISINPLNPLLPQNSKQGQTGRIVGVDSPGKLVVVCDAVVRPGISVEMVLKEYFKVGVSMKPVGLTVIASPPIVMTSEGTTPPDTVEVGKVVVVDPKIKVPPCPKETRTLFIVTAAPPGITVIGLPVPSLELLPVFEVLVCGGITISNPEELSVAR